MPTKPFNAYPWQMSHCLLNQTIIWERKKRFNQIIIRAKKTKIQPSHNKSKKIKIKLDMLEWYLKCQSSAQNGYKITLIKSDVKVKCAKLYPYTWKVYVLLFIQIYLASVSKLTSGTFLSSRERQKKRSQHQETLKQMFFKKISGNPFFYFLTVISGSCTKKDCIGYVASSIFKGLFCY